MGGARLLASTGPGWRDERVGGNIASAQEVIRVRVRVRVRVRIREHRLGAGGNA